MWFKSVFYDRCHLKRSFPPIIRKPDGTACLCKIKYFYLFMIPLTWIKCSAPSLPKHPHSITDPTTTVEATHSSFDHYPGFIHAYTPILLLNFYWSSHNSFYHAFKDLFVCVLVHNSLFCLFIFRNTCFLMAMYPSSPADLSRSFRVKIDIGCCRMKLRSTVNTEAIFLLFLLLLTIKCLSPTLLFVLQLYNSF